MLRDMPGRYSVVYLCREFEVQDVSKYSVLDLLVNFDDGFIVWINGHRVIEQTPPRKQLSE